MRTVAIRLLQARSVLAVAFLCFGAIWPAHGAEWEKTVSRFAPGPVLEPRPVRVRYNFGWSGFSAARIDVGLNKLSNGSFRFEATGGTIGLARTLWDYNLNHVALSNAETLRPIEVKEVEDVRSKHVTTALAFSSSGVTSEREEQKDGVHKSKTRRFEFPDVLSLNSALLFLRSQAMPNGAAYRVVVYPATSAYLCTVTVVGREGITIPAGKYEAIKLNIQLSKIGETRELLPHKKFRKATVWLSDDADRLVLRSEAQIFIGKVFAELRSVQFASVKQ